MMAHTSYTFHLFFGITRDHMSYQWISTLLAFVSHESSYVSLIAVLGRLHIILGDDFIQLTLIITFYKDEDPNNHMMWTFGSSFFFSMNVFTTTGYGSIAPESMLGKSCVVIYGFLFVPLTLVVIRHLGNWTLVILTNIYAKFPAYLMGTTTFIFIYDKLSGPPGTGIDYFLSFYFSFISISTIGLGDVMPNNVTVSFDPLITILFFFGMPLMKVVNSSTYQCVEKSTIGTRWPHSVELLSLILE
uniref:Ion_trans_2 domain-containing protein n=1 Tax=Angiostrongylus cantonensis TaxID=6313 RepID=A0A0K0CYY7_ANGCA